MNFNFTASVEKEFDEIAIGNLNWPNMIERFYNPKRRHSTLGGLSPVEYEKQAKLA